MLSERLIKELHNLNSAEKLRAIQILANALQLEELGFDPNAHYEINLPIEAPEASAQLTKMLEEHKANKLNFPVDSYGSWPDDLSLGREDMYDDDGR